jgi:hypothetical protein
VKAWELSQHKGASAHLHLLLAQGEEDPDPKKAEQYRRWRELRKLQHPNNAGQGRN